ncbi:class I SAM-dependent methyltransferase [Actinocorallia longicatena]|uniref:Class I SAM-dependent methyltransferase n=1 Tax=Actinocorallia longicatena TaxID=111803 RepID=A0ABP6QHN3_9ACTN
MGEADYLRETRVAYDAAAARYLELYGAEFEPRALDRGMYGAFAARIPDGGAVLDVGCGPGHVTAYLRGLGLAADGVDLSPVMVKLAREARPEPGFEVAPMDALPVSDAALAGIVALYSIIHTPPEHVPGALEEFRRALAPGGHLLMAFQVTEEGTQAEEIEHKIAPAHRWPVGLMETLLRKAGFTEVARLLRDPGEGERFPRAFLLSQRTR